MIFIKVNGYMVKNMVTVNYILMMVECSKVNFKTAKYKVNFLAMTPISVHGSALNISRHGV